MKVAVGIDIGGTNTVFGFTDMEGKIHASGKLPTNLHEDPSLFVEDLAKEIRQVQQNTEQEFEIAGIGLGAPNGNFYKGTIEFAPNLRWKGVVHLVELIRNHFDVPVVLTNDANAAAIGEMIYGAAKGMKNFMEITLGTGVGSGIVINGQLLYGHDGFAGEIGHMIVDPNGRDCGCGRKGCLETYASATGIVKTMQELLAGHPEFCALREKENLSSKDIYNAAKDGDPLALEAFDLTCRMLGFKLADAVAVTSPEAIILFGGLAQAQEFIFAGTKKYMEENLLEIFKNKVSIIPSMLPESDAAILGAAALIWDLNLSS